MDMYDKELKSDVFDEENYPDGICKPIDVIVIIEEYWKDNPSEGLLYGDWIKLAQYIEKNIVY